TVTAAVLEDTLFSDQINSSLDRGLPIRTLVFGAIPFFTVTTCLNSSGFKLFADKGIKKIILDLSNNDGGDVFIGHYINKLLFTKFSVGL
ncbi:10566_t:CDS:2, partial [Gigaspora rosea]